MIRMQMDDMILVRIDDHMIEPPDKYKNHVPKKWLGDDFRVLDVPRLDL